MKKHFLYHSLFAVSLLFTAQTLSAQTPGGAQGVSVVAWLTPENYNGAVWTNLATGAGTVGNFSQSGLLGESYTISYAKPPVKVNRGYNFHQSLLFEKTGNSLAPNRLQSAAAYTHFSADNVTTIFVLKRKTGSHSDNGLLSLNNAVNTDDEGDIVWNSNTSGQMAYYWAGTTDRLNSSSYSANEGLITIDNANSTNTTTGGIDFYLNGGRLGSRVTSGGNPQYNNGSRIVIGGGYDRYASTYGYEGDIQEVIILKANGINPHLTDVDFSKIHSYLAIKYGFTLEGNPSYLNSAGTVIWQDATYNKNIFGIGRDDDGGLYQKQSTSNNSDVITAFIDTICDLNHQNPAIFPMDKTHLIFGSNGLAGEITYNYPLNTQFANVQNTQYILNNRTNEIWKTRLTVDNTQAIATQTINIKVNNSLVKYVLVCSDINFNATNTRIYEVNNYIANAVQINNGDYVSLGKFVPTPGGATGNFVAWLAPENYNGMVWANQATGSSAVGDFSQNGLLGSTANIAPPAKVNRGYNYHPSVFFVKTDNNQARNRLQSAKAYSNTANENVTTVFVLKRKTRSYNDNGLLSLNNAGGWGTDEGDIAWNSGTSGQMFYHWNDGGNKLDNNAVANEEIITIDNANNTNTTTGGIDFYLNGGRLGSRVSSGGSKAYNNGSRVVLGGTYEQYAAGWGYEGDIQEVIVFKANSTNSHLSTTDFQKLHSYLGLKYGISIKLNSAADNYLDSQGDVIWNYDSKYNSHIFGLGRDDEGGLYQKQAVSNSHSILKMYIGSKLQPLNSQNTAALPNRKYLVVGHDGSNGWFSHNILSGTTYENGTIYSDLNFHSGVYKAQVSGDADFTVKFQMASSIMYVMVSKTDAFTPATTRFFPLTAGIGEITLDNEWRYFRFSGYSAGPGNVASGLMLWLRADDANMLTIENTDKNDATLNGLSQAEKDEVPGPTLPAVVGWNDYIRNHNYTYANTAGAGGNAKKPVFEPISPLMNFHAGLRFYHTGSSTGTTLRNNGQIMTSAAQGEKHTAIFVTNSGFATGGNDWLYPMSFNSDPNTSTWNGVQYGFQRTVNNDVVSMVGRMRLDNNTDRIGTQDLYRAGSTSILQYDFSLSPQTITFNFNGKTEQITHPLSATPPGLMLYSNISGGYQYDRVLEGAMSEVIIYTGVITTTDREKINAYLALKYGVMLYPNNNTNGRYDYTIKDKTIDIWKGETDATNKYSRYYNNVAAVVRDDGTLLNNRQSHSTGSGSILHLGVAGAALGGTEDELGELQDGEAVAFGSNNGAGITTVYDLCGDYQNVFNRNWLLHKVTNGNRPAPMLVGIENNSGNLLGNSASAATAADRAYYNVINPLNKFAMFVSDDSTKINPNHANFAMNDFKVIPMQYINGEWQCNYTFAKEDTYITFAYKSSAPGCTATIQFAGTKTLSWNDWKHPTHKKSDKQSEGILLTKPAVDLGDGITATTSIQYAPKVRSYYGYPALVNQPKNALEIRRSYGAVGDKVTVIIEFNDVVVPEFSISGLDGYARNYDEVTIYGSCNANGGGSGSGIIPVLKSAGINPVFTITGNKATVNQYKWLGTTDKNGMLEVVFETGVRNITIEYTLTNRADGNTQNIIISPVTIRQGALPPPLINTDGVAFQQQVQSKTISTCDRIEYTFLIQNATMKDKYFNFRDTLPDWLTWQAESVGVNSYNPKMKAILDYAGNRILALDSILVPCVSTVKVTAIAKPNERASGLCVNSVFLSYENDEGRDTVIVSMDAETRELHTDVEVIYDESYFPLEIYHDQPRRYQDDDTVTVVMKIYNPNSQNVENLFMNVNWGSNFKYVSKSLIVDGDSIEGTYLSGSGYANVQPATPYVPSDTIQFLFIAGTNDGSMGFTLAAMDTTFLVFKTKAPDFAHLVYETDEYGSKTSEVRPLIVSYDFFMDSPDLCALNALNKTAGELVVPFRDPLFIDSIRYSAGPNIGGTYIGESGSANLTSHWGIDAQGRVTIYGDGFTLGQNTEVLFGGVLAQITFREDDSLRVIPPAVSNAMAFSTGYTPEYGGEGTVDVMVKNMLYTAILKDGYTYRAPITIDSIKPDNGPVSGGTEIIIKGHNFLPPSIFPHTPVYVIFEATDGRRDSIRIPDSMVDGAGNPINLNDTLIVVTLPNIVNTSRVWIDNLREKTDTIFVFYPNVFSEDGKWTEYWKWENHTSENILPYPLADIHIKANVLQDIDVNMDSITVYPAITYTVDTAQTVKTNVFTLQNNASFLNHGKDSIVTARALQILTQGRNWYVSSPMQGGALPAIDPALIFDTLGNNLNTTANMAIAAAQDKKWRVEYYDETKVAAGDIHGYGKWELMQPADAFVTGRGYVAYSDSADIAVQFIGKFTDGKNVSALSQTLTNTPDGHPKRAFNLVGNPYPSYWRWTAATAAAANTYSTIWYRTNTGVPPNKDAYQFWAYNAAGDVAVAPGWEDETQAKPYSLAYIPPMQAFWVKLRETANNTQITFDNARRSHSNNVSNILKIGAQNERQLVRLSVETLRAVSRKIDETLIYAHDNAQPYFDDYDSEKMFNNSGAEIYTLAQTGNPLFNGTPGLVINGIPRICAGLEIPLGFTAGLGGSFALRASEITGIDTLEVILLDKWRSEEFNMSSSLSEVEGYNFTAGSGSNTERFGILFRPKSPTGTDNANYDGNALFAYSNAPHRITVLLTDANLRGKTATVQIFDISGRKLIEQSISENSPTTIAATFASGVYIIKTGTKTARVVVE